VKHSFLPEAEAEYLDAVRFYEERRDGLCGALKLALERPLAWRQVHSTGIRRIGLMHFPYAIFYRILEDELQITAFAHHRKRPGYWLPRIDGVSP